MSSVSIRHHQAEALGSGEQLLEARALSSQDGIDQADFGIDQIEHGVLLAEQLLLRGFGCDKNKPKRERDEPDALLLLEDDAIVDRSPIEHKSDQHTLTRHEIAQAGFHLNDDVHWMHEARVARSRLNRLQQAKRSAIPENKALILPKLELQDRNQK